MFIVNEKPMSLSSEAYGKLRTSVEYSFVDKALKTIVVTSVNSGEGKTTVSGNLAYALATNEKKVLILDCDLRKPTMHKRHNISNDIGLTDYLVGKAKITDVIKKIEKDVHIITAGTRTPNPAELIRSNTLEELLKNLSEDYDHIVIDTPPVGNMDDGRILAAKCDGTVIVVKSGATKGKDVTRVLNDLESVQATVLGTVLNGISHKKSKYYYYYSNDEDDNKKNRKRRK